MTTFQLWQILSSIIGSIVILLGVVVTIRNFGRSHTNSFQSSFWSKQLNYYLQASTYAAELTEHTFDSSDYKTSRKNFNVLYWGPMSIVEDKKVKGAMKEFRNELLIYESNIKDEKALARLQQKSFQLARTCRESSIKRWDLREFNLD